MSKVTESCKLGEAIHSSFRTATDCEQAMLIWKLIMEMPDLNWNEVLESIYEHLPDRIRLAMETEALAATYQDE